MNSSRWASSESTTHLETGRAWPKRVQTRMANRTKSTIRPTASRLASGRLAIAASKQHVSAAGTLPLLDRWIAGGDGDAHFRDARLPAGRHHRGHVLIGREAVAADRHFQVFILPMRGGELAAHFGQRDGLCVGDNRAVAKDVDGEAALELLERCGAGNLRDGDIDRVVAVTKWRTGQYTSES